MYPMKGLLSFRSVVHIVGIAKIKIYIYSAPATDKSTNNFTKVTRESMSNG